MQIHNETNKQNHIKKVKDYLDRIKNKFGNIKCTKCKKEFTHARMYDLCVINSLILYCESCNLGTEIRSHRRMFLFFLKPKLTIKGVNTSCSFVKHQQISPETINLKTMTFIGEPELL